LLCEISDYNVLTVSYEKIGAKITIFKIPATNYPLLFFYFLIISDKPFFL